MCIRDSSTVDEIMPPTPEQPIRWGSRPSGQTVAAGHAGSFSASRRYPIRHRFTNREVMTRQIFMFGPTGGRVPCPASIAALLLCLQLKKIALGTTPVLSFSIGLA